MICYQIGGIGIGFTLDLPLQESQYYRSFRISKQEFEKLVEKEIIRFYLKKPERKELDKIICDSTRKQIGYCGDSIIAYYHRYPGREYYACFERNLKTGEGSIFLSPDCLNDLIQTSDLFDLADMLSVWLRYETLMIHSSYLIYQNKAVLFTGPSGIGKSTQAALWERELGAMVINGDRSLVRREVNGWRVYGVPNCGSSAISKNESAELAGIILLEQSTENQLTAPPMVECYRKLLTQIVMNRYEETECVQTMELLQRLMEEVTVKKLSCLPNREAVFLVKESLGL